MKRFFTYISILAAVLTAGVSCSREVSFDENQDGGRIRLHFVTEQMGTRVTVKDPANPATVAGVGAENAIDHLDYFFFADDNPASEAIVSGSLSVNELTPVEGSETEYTYDGFDTSEDDYAVLKDPSYLYVLVNYPWAENQVIPKTMAELLALPITADFKKAQTSFVMDTYDRAKESSLLYLSPSVNSSSEVREVEVNLARVAAKLVLKFNVKNSFTDEVGNVWTPVTNMMWANFLHGRKNATVAAEPVEFDDDADNLFNTEQETPTSITAVDADHTSWTISPVYTFPLSYETSDVTAPYFKIFCPWTCEKRGLNNFYYKIILPELGSFQRNKIYTMTVDVSVVGSTEEDWAMVSDYIYVADWWAPEAIKSTFEGAMYLDVPVKEYSIYGVNYVDIPVMSSNDIQVTNVTGTKRNLYQTNESASDVYLSVTPSISNISKDGFRLTHNLNDDVTSTSYDCTPITYTMTVKHTQGGLSKTVNVKVVQYPSIYGMRIRSNGYVYVNGQGGGDSQINVYNNNGQYNSYNIGTVAQRSGVNGNGSNNNQNNYNIYVSVLPANSQDVIGDPRFGYSAVNNLGFATFSSWRNYTVDNTVSSKYKAAGTNTEHVIAPAFKIASSYGKTTPMTKERARERCASYQEDGFPAGRWRLPTSAEVLFVRNLSRYNHIPPLFQTHINNGYWTSDNYIYSADEYGDITTNTSSTRSVRCVYDVWYWGEAPLTNQGANATPVKDAYDMVYDYNNEATQWLGFHMD